MATFSTGQVARLLQVPEPRLADLVRRGKVSPRPPVIAGRRAWTFIHILQAAQAAGAGIAPEDIEQDVAAGDGASDSSESNRPTEIPPESTTELSDGQGGSHDVVSGCGRDFHQPRASFQAGQPRERYGSSHSSRSSNQ